MEVEVWVAWRCKEIAAWIPTDREVTRSMDAQKAVGEVSLHPSREGCEVREVGDQGGDLIISAPRAGCNLGNVASEAAGVVAETRHVRVGSHVREDR